MTGGVGAAATLIGMVAGSVVITGAGGETVGDAVGDAISFDRAWLFPIFGLLTALVGAPWLVAWIQRRENRKLTLSNAEKSEADAELARAGAERARQEVVDSLFDRYEKREKALLERVDSEADLRRRLREEVDQLRHDLDRVVEEHRDERRRDDEARMVHAAWDHLALTHLRAIDGMVMPDPPPLRGAGST